MGGSDPFTSYQTSAASVRHIARTNAAKSLRHGENAAARSRPAQRADHDVTGLCTGGHGCRHLRV